MLTWKLFKLGSIELSVLQFWPANIKCVSSVKTKIAGQNETKLIERDIELQVKELLNELRYKSLSVPEQFSEKEWSGEAARRLVKFERKITLAFQQHPLVVSHTNGRVWTIWNAVVYCSTLYTTIGKPCTTGQCFCLPIPNGRLRALVPYHIHW